MMYSKCYDEQLGTVNGTDNLSNRRYPNCEGPELLGWLALASGEWLSRVRKTVCVWIRLVPSLISPRGTRSVVVPFRHRTEEHLLAHERQAGRSFLRRDSEGR